jgi:hypothetical protein
VESWLGEIRVRQAARPFEVGWRSEGRVSAFTFEDPFIRNIGLADFLDYLALEEDPRARQVLKGLSAQFQFDSFGSLSEWSFHQLNMKKCPDPLAKGWVSQALEQGHEVFIVSNSATGKIHDFLDQTGFSKDLRPEVRGGARKFGLGSRPQPMEIGSLGNDRVLVDTDRPEYERALLEIAPDLVIGDVFCLGLALPIRLKREGRLPRKGGIFYRHRDYSPTPMVELVSGRSSRVPEVTVLREWDQLRL